MPPPIKVLIVEDDDMFALALTAMLEIEPRIDVVGRASNAGEAIRLVGELQPDVVTMDIDMGGTNGVDATRGIMGGAFAAPIILVSGSDLDERVAEALAAGAVVQVAKDKAITDLVPAIVAAAAR